MTRVTLSAAKADLSNLVDRALAGGDIVITRSGKPVVRLMPVREKRVPGSAKGLIWLSPDFDDPLPDDILDAFEGR